MLSTWVSKIVIVVMLVNGVRNDDSTQSCGKVHVSDTVVALGSPVTATCVIREDCPQLSGQAVQIEWRLDGHFVPGNPAANESDRISRVVISSFNYTMAVLTCGIQSSQQVVDGAIIKAGFPPESAQNLSCQTNLTRPLTLTCRWDPGQQDTHLLTNYILHTEIRELDMNYTYKPPPGVHHYIIPRPDFGPFSEMKIFVTAENELGEATSEPIVLVPASAGKFDQPNILQVVPEASGCLSLRWSLAQKQYWMRHNSLDLEIKLKISDIRNPAILVRRVPPHYRVPTGRLKQCNLLHGTRYLAQIRVRYQESPWSEWSSSHSGVTSESAPTGRLDTWMKVSGGKNSPQLNIHLFWKPSKQFRANSVNVSYVVSVQKQRNRQERICSTTENYCIFKIPRGIKKVFLYAENAEGKSFANEVCIYKYRVSLAQSEISDVTAVPQDNNSILVQWKSEITSNLIGYVVEYLPLLKNSPSYIQFETSNKDQSNLTLTGSFEPYKPFGISVYPRFKDGIGLPQTVTTYVRQKAPSEVPKLLIKKTWNSHVELTWDETALEKQNGIIQNYKLFYWLKNGHINNVITTNPEMRKVTLKNLKTASLYEAFLMVSTSGGSLNGSIIHFEVEPFERTVVVIVVFASAAGLSLLVMLLAVACISKHKSSELQGYFWPVVPDPANSSIKRWASESTQYTHSSCDCDEPNPVFLSHLSFLDLTTKLSKEDDDLWLNNSENTSDLGESICGSPFIPEYSGSNGDSVPYATVLFSGPCISPSPVESHVYLRSESSQPLLASEESFTPECYQNLANETDIQQCFFGPSDDIIAESREDIADLWDDFPFLRALALNDNENE